MSHTTNSSMISAEDSERLHSYIDDFSREVNHHIKGKVKQVELTILGAISEGHVLVEDVPGVGKTTLARSLARALGVSFQRVQCTADLLPSDLTGVNVYHPGEGKFKFQKGPVFTHLLLADELNRATPKAQSSLLEVMEEQQVTSDGVTRQLPNPFWVIATQNPLRFAGTFKLPESQLDRFAVSISLGYLSPQIERDVLLSSVSNSANHEHGEAAKYDNDESRLNKWRALIAARSRVQVNSDLAHYIAEFASQTRQDRELKLGVSTRGALSWLKLCQARALRHRRHYVIPEDVIELAIPALAHRIWLEGAEQSREARESYLKSLVNRQPIPR